MHNCGASYNFLLERQKIIDTDKNISNHLVISRHKPNAAHIDIMMIVSSAIAWIRGSRMTLSEIRILIEYLNQLVSELTAERFETHSNAATAIPTALVPIRKFQYSCELGI